MISAAPTSGMDHIPFTLDKRINHTFDETKVMGMAVGWSLMRTSFRAMAIDNGVDWYLSTGLLYGPNTGVGIVAMTNVYWGSGVTLPFGNIEKLMFDAGEALIE
jgi:hypothetical protein